jgi:allantoin racemase
MSGTAEQLAHELGVPVVDPVAAAVTLVESLIDLRLATGKTTSYATPRPKQRQGWPISARPVRSAS